MWRIRTTYTHAKRINGNYTWQFRIGSPYIVKFPVWRSEYVLGNEVGMLWASLTLWIFKHHLAILWTNWYHAELQLPIIWFETVSHWLGVERLFTRSAICHAMLTQNDSKQIGLDRSRNNDRSARNCTSISPIHTYNFLHSVVPELCKTLMCLVERMPWCWKSTCLISVGVIRILNPVQDLESGAWHLPS